MGYQMTLRSVEMAHGQLGVYFDDFVSAVDVATRHFWSKYADDAHRLTTICRANITVSYTHLTLPTILRV